MDVILSFTTMSENIAVDKISRSIQRVIRESGNLRARVLASLPCIIHQTLYFVRQLAQELR